MSLDKFIDDGIGLIITPPPVEKADEDLEKYNRCHGPNGRFCSGGGGHGGGGGGGGSGAVDDGDEEAEPIPGQDSLVNEDFVLSFFTDYNTGYSREDLDNMWYMGENAARDLKVTNMHTMWVKQIEGDSAAQVNYSFGEVKGKPSSNVVLTVDPYKFDMVRSNYHEDQIALKEGKLPWGANAHAPTPDDAIRAVVTHEMAHAKMIENTVSRPTKLWLNEDSPGQGDKPWMHAINKAIEKGWPGPSVYGQKDTAECFAESVVLFKLKGTTGDAGVDKYIKGVLK